MGKHKEEGVEGEFDEDGFDPTKEAFFSDLIGMEEEIASEAYELVEHAINLIDTKYYDDCIEILRQAIGLYSQINREEEIKAINEKISQIYILKEQAFRKEEVETEQTIERTRQFEIPEEKLSSDLKGELAKEEVKIDLLGNAAQLINEGNHLQENNNFEGALDKYDEAIEIFENMGKKDDVDRVFKLIEQCYNKKAAFLRSLKTDASEAPVKAEEKEISEDEQVKEDKLEQYLASKKREEEISTQAYELIGQAAELSNKKQYKDAMQLYAEGSKLFQELGWDYEVKKIQETISQLEAERVSDIKALESQKLEQKEKIAPETSQVIDIEQQVTERKEEERIKKFERLRGIELQKMETDFFKAQIDNMATEASRMAREYELTMQKAIKKGELVEKCIYPQVIEIYNKIKELLIDKGWRNEAAIYDDTIEFYIQKFEQDKKIRLIELDKKKKRKEAAELLKIPKKEDITTLPSEQIQESEEQQKTKLEIQQIKIEIEEMTNRAERLAREYELALRKGKFELKCPYPEIIKIFKRVRQQSLENGWETDATIYLSQIQVYKEKLEKDRNLRKIEAEKALKQKEVEDMLKVQRQEKKLVMEEEKLKKIQDQKRLEDEEKEFEQQINNMIKNAEKIARTYDLDMKKAVRKGKLAKSPPFEEIINIYERAKQMMLAKGRNEETIVYSNRIDYYKQRWEKDKKLREIEARKKEKQKEIDEMHKVSRKVEIDKDRLKTIEKKKEEEDFEKFIDDMVNKAEKLVREHEIALRKALKKDKIPEETPYQEVIEIYRQIREKVYARGWKSQAEIFTNQIKIYQEKLAKHDKLLEIEARKKEKQKEINEMHKAETTTELEQGKLKKLAKKKEDKEFQQSILKRVNHAEKMEREYDLAMKKALKNGEFIEETPYPKIIEIYRQIQNELLERGWVEQSQIYFNQIKIFQEKLEKSKILREVEAKKAKRQKDLEEMHKVKEEFKPARPDKLKESKEDITEEDRLLDNAMNLIDEAEKLVKNYEISIKTDVLLYESPYDRAISNYNEAKNIFQDIGWNDEANRLINTIKFYKEKQEKDEKLRTLEKEKLKEPEAELIAAKIDTEKDLFAKEKKILEFEKKKKEDDKLAQSIFNEIHIAEKKAQEYELNIKDGNFDLESPYEEILKIYRKARKQFEDIGWLEESMKLLNTIKFYKKKLEKDKKLRSLELEKQKKKEEEALMQQKLLAQAKAEQERILKKRKESLLKKEQEIKEFESTKDGAFRLMDRAKNELRQDNFEKAIELYKKSEEIFSQINWQEGINMVKDSISMIKRKKKSMALEQEEIEKKKIEKLKIEEKLEEKLVKAEELRRLQQEQKRKEFLKKQREKEREREISKDAFKLLEQGTSLVKNKKFNEAYEKYMEARRLFNRISWKREVSRINNELLFKLKRERKTFEILEDIKKKKREELKEMQVLKEETEKEQREFVRKKREEKRKLEKEKFDRKTIETIEKAEKLIENFKYNEGVKILKSERKKFEKGKKETELNKIDETIKQAKEESQVPIITLEPIDDLRYRSKMEIAYKALDKAQISINNNRFMKAISELKESRFHIEDLKLNKEYLKDIDEKILDLQKKLGKKHLTDDKEPPEEKDLLKARIAARREERRKKVLDLLKK